MEYLNDSRIVMGVTSMSQLLNGHLGEIHKKELTFIDQQPSIDIVFNSNNLLYLTHVFINSTSSNLKRFRIQLLNNENDVQYTIESASMLVNLESLPSIVLAGIRLQFIETTDNRPPTNIRLSIQGCAKKIDITAEQTSTTAASTTTRIYPTEIPITPGKYIYIVEQQSIER
jgi:hypothetical protein